MVYIISTNSADSAQPAAMSVPPLNPASALLFVVNAASGAFDTAAKRAVIEAALAARGRRGELLICRPAELSQVAAQAAAAAVATHTAVIAVGGDGSLNAVAQAAHAAGCPMGVIPYGTFNYFARTHGIPTDPVAAARMLLDARPLRVQVAAINDRLFLVNASLGIYPELLQRPRDLQGALRPQPLGCLRGGLCHLAALATSAAAAHRDGRHGPRRTDPDALCGQQSPAVAAVRCRPR